MINVMCVRVVSAIATNCYIVNAVGSSEAVIIDPGAEYDKLQAVLRDNKLTAKAVLLTHAHYDHCNAAARFQADGCKIYMHANDLFLLESKENLAARHGLEFNCFKPDVLVADGESIRECGITFKVIHTPGHTSGSVCYVAENCIFSGDTLFCLSVGRTDFATSSTEDIISSVKELFALEGDYFVYPGHGDGTTLDFERKYNPYVRT